MNAFRRTIGFGLTYLRSFPFDRIKIDRSFVSLICESSESRAIVKAVAELGATLGMTTTAEGVETEEQYQLIRENGCTDRVGCSVAPTSV